MMITGQLPAAAEQANARALRRRHAMMPYFPDARIVRYYVWASCSVIWDEEGRLVVVACDVDIPATVEEEKHATEEWRQAVEVLRMSGRITGDGPVYDDIGEPDFDPAAGVWLWVLTLP